MLRTAMMMVGAHAASAPAIEDYFSAFIYTGNGGTQDIVNGLDLAGKGGLVWFKARVDAFNHRLFDTVNGAGYNLLSNGTFALQTQADSLTAFNANGFSLGADSGNGVNKNTSSYVAWSFAQAAKFFKVAGPITVSGSNQTVDLSSLGTVGMVVVKRTDNVSGWYTLHRGNSAGKLCYLSTTQAETTDGSIELSGTTLTIVQAQTGNGTFIVYAWAHDASATGLIQCGTFTTDGSGNASVTLGWEAQWVLARPTSSGGINWYLRDSTRAWTADATEANLYPNTSGTEATGTGLFKLNATGFTTYAANLGATQTWIYVAIRRGPMKAPTVGTQIFNAIARTGTSADATITGLGFPPDLILSKGRNTNVQTPQLCDRLRGYGYLRTGLTDPETTLGGDNILSYGMDGFTLGADASNFDTNITGTNYVLECFRRYPGVFDEVCYTETGSTQTQAHNLGVAPELIIVKARSIAGQSWAVQPNGDGTKLLKLDTTGAIVTDSAYWNNTNPTSSVFTIGPAAGITNNSGTTYVAYLFATKPGISKVDSYTGNGTNQTIACGFMTGARFILIKRTDDVSDWFVWDSIRGIVAGNDPRVSMNATAAEVTTYDDIDADNSGFVVNETSGTHINTLNATYIYLAFA
jgi:hypothetical protein